MKHVLLDANIPLNVWLENRPMALESEAVIRAVGNGKVRGYMTSTLVLYVLIYLNYPATRRALSQRGNELLDIITVIEQPKSDFRAALADGWKDIEDGVQYCSAKRTIHPIDTIITMNSADFKHVRGMEVLTPAAFVAKYL